ncbi:Alanine dehydrogenase [Desulfovibrionales bacterium]
MRIGIPKEIKMLENRVAMTAGGVASLTSRKHEVFVQSGAGLGSGITDEEYARAGAKLVSAEQSWNSTLVIKVKEPIELEYKYLRKDLLLFTYLHLAADLTLTETLLATGTTSIAYETVQLPSSTLPLLTPMSEVAGRMATQVGSHYLEKPQGGRGLLLGGVPGVPPASVVIVGGGVVGTNAAHIAVGMGAQVMILDVNHGRLQYLDDIYRGRIITISSNESNIHKAIQHANLLIGAVLIVGAKAPQLITREMLKEMKPGTVIVDVAVDQGGCVETIRPTTHAEPSYEVDGIIHYGVTNMPSAVPRTSTFALTNQTLPYVIKLANKGVAAMYDDSALALGLNTRHGRLTCQAVGETFNIPCALPLQTIV